MAYQTYITEAIVCGSKDYQTSDRSFLLFTEEAGMLWATARSVRVEKSKQRYALQDFSIIRVSLIKGKSGWRIGSVEAISNPFMEAQTRSARASIQKTVKMMRRFLHGTEPYPLIYRDAVMALSCLEVAEGRDVIDLSDLFALRMLYNLGYIALDDSFKEIITSQDPWSIYISLPPLAHQTIEKAVMASHL